MKRKEDILRDIRVKYEVIMRESIMQRRESVESY